MATERRLSVLNRHINVARGDARARDIYLWLTRDNVELRDRMLDFLKVRRIMKPYDARVVRCQAVAFTCERR